MLKQLMLIIKWCKCDLIVTLASISSNLVWLVLGLNIDSVVFSITLGPTFDWSKKQMYRLCSVINCPEAMIYNTHQCVWCIDLKQQRTQKNYDFQLQIDYLTKTLKTSFRLKIISIHNTYSIAQNCDVCNFALLGSIEASECIYVWVCVCERERKERERDSKHVKIG